MSDLPEFQYEIKKSKKEREISNGIRSCVYLHQDERYDLTNRIIIKDVMSKVRALIDRQNPSSSVNKMESLIQ